MIALVGFMGAGKSTVGRVLAERMDLPFIDADEVIESRAGKPIAAIFEDDGEDVFRRLEADVVQQALTGGDVVIALGGGALGDENTREALAGAMVVYLDVDLEEALKRVGDDARRPKLGSVDLKALLSERVPTYRAVADAIVTTTGRPLEEIADEVVVVVGEQQDGARDGKVRVELGDRSYDVTIGSALSGRIASYLPPEAEEIAVITHPTLEALAAPLIGALQSAGRSVHVITVPEGETSKSWAQAAGLLDRMASIPLHRKDVVIAFGGGVIGDLAGFVASTYARGLRLIQVPTSLLAQVDAAIGGKTAVNLDAGKNLAGTWHQPLAVFCDTKTLRSLPEAELRSGLAEVVKYGLIAAPDLLRLVAERADEIFNREQKVLRTIVTRSAGIKAEIVSADEREQGKRAWLNYGHTLGHAIEHLHGGRLRHGEAIALGMMAAAYIAEDSGRIDEEAVTLHRTTLEAVGLPVRASLELEALQGALTRDKKYEGGVRFVLLEGLAQPRAGVPVGMDEIERALKRMAE